jgi:(2Fe-2S) ferredoxin
MDGEDEALIGRALGLERYTHHVLLCTGPSCCTSTQGFETWSVLNRGVDPDVCETIITQHLLGGTIVESHVFAQNPNMGGGDAS